METPVAYNADGGELAQRNQTPQSKTSVLQRLASRYGIKEDAILNTIKATIFDGKGTSEQMVAFCAVADQYRLNPFLREIYAFPDNKTAGKIVPVVGIDGWLRLINAQPTFDGLTTEQTDDACTCTIYRKDRKYPTVVTEYLAECKRNSLPWNTAPKRMLRHRAIIQCARVAFSFGGIYDPEEAREIAEAEVVSVSTPFGEQGDNQSEEKKPKEGSLRARAIEAAKEKKKAEKPQEEKPEPKAETLNLDDGDFDDDPLPFV